FVARLDGDGRIVSARAVARGTVDCVLALPGVARKGDMVLHNHPSGLLEPSHADLSVAAQMHDSGVGFGIINNAATELYVVVEVPRPRETKPLDAVGVADQLGPDGPIADLMERFEDRPSQRDMAAYIADTYNDGGISLLEAGTGVGKSFAYLLPALAWSRQNGERTVVSTNTINLQEQLIGKDLPLLAGALKDDERPPTFALLKGWRNYVCLARLEIAAQGQRSLLEPEKHEELDRLVKWSQSTSDGSRADLPVGPSSEVWDEVAAEADLCTRLKCPFFDNCFVFEARRKAADADVVVVNHHLLAADLGIRMASDNWFEAAVLPPYSRLILDEAHHLEDVASQHLGSRVTVLGVVRLLSRLERNGKGLLPALMTDLRERGDLLSDVSLELVRDKILPAVTDARTRAEQLFNFVTELVAEESGQLRLDEEFAAHPIWERGLGVALDNFVAVMASIKDGVELVADRLELEDDFDRRSQLLHEVRGVVRRLANVIDGLLATLRPKSGGRTVRWVERTGSQPVGAIQFPVSLSSVPLNVADILRETLFDKIETVVLTSATLASSGNFDFTKQRTGLDQVPGRIRYEESLESPFDFATQCLLALPTDGSDPRSDAVGHDRGLVETVTDLAELSGGGMFVLFTSHAQLRRIASVLRQTMSGRGTLLVQGDDQRDRLLRRFRDLGNAILLGTDSFWEGVDVPGAALRALVIAKLPFKVPSEPLTAARLDLLRDEGRDP
ncbi:MAG: helicase C-terminal domain-containing protein, partial [Gemmatimonadales bacterium]